MDSSTTRIIDASLNRIGEGLRVLEDVARLVLNDRALSQQLKNTRHELLHGDLPFNLQLLQARDSESDVGIDIEAPEQKEKRGLVNTVIANSRRVQESLRTLEELAKLPDALPELDSEKYKKARFAIYTIEQTIVAKLLRQDKIKQLSGLYVIIDTQALKEPSYTKTTREVINGGARVIQLRDKVHTRRELLKIASELKTLCSERNTLFLVNAHLDVALAVDADGVHLEQDDLPVKVARRLLPIDKIIGCSTRTVEQALATAADGTDYIMVGSIYTGKPKAPAEVVGIELLREVRRAVTSPVIAIGGINCDNVTDVMAAGADGVAVVSAELQTSLAESARQIIAKIEAKDEKTKC